MRECRIAVRTAIRFLFVMPSRLLWAGALIAMASWCANGEWCAAGAKMQRAIGAAESAAGNDPRATEQNIAPFAALRRSYPEDLFIHERYQDAVQHFGIEGYLRALSAEYEELWKRHANETVYRYLHVRTLVGRETPRAIVELSEIVSKAPDFAPGHRTLAEIYGTARFRDAAKEIAERELFLAQCPGGSLGRRPDPLPEASRLLERAEESFHGGGDARQAIAMAAESLTEDEWRGQRMRAFDWYGADEKRRNRSEMRAEYWRAWVLEVRCYRKLGQYKKAKAMLADMDARVAAMPMGHGEGRENALASLAELYTESGETEKARRKREQLASLAQ